jgi:hypothetical protein
MTNEYEELNRKLRWSTLTGTAGGIHKYAESYTHPGYVTWIGH